jgi:cytoskeletal protein CcmA (bactofilin family)
MSIHMMSFLGGEPVRRNSRSRAVGAPEGALRNNSSAPPQASPTPPEKCQNILSSGAKWEGKLTVDSSVRIDGVFEGEIVSKSTVHVADGAQVNAKIQAEFIAVNGEFSGELNGEERTNLMPGSRVRGDVNTKVLIVQEGAMFDGRIRMATGQALEAPAEEKVTVETPAAEVAEELQPILVAPTI